MRSGYFFEQKFSAATVQQMLSHLEPSNSIIEVAKLTAGVVRLDAVIYWSNGQYQLGYDLMVKDTPTSPMWICYDSLPDEVRYNAWNLEREMFLVLDRTVENYGLSYTECGFASIEGSTAQKQ